MDFDPAQTYPSTVMAWIRLPRLLGHIYKRQVLREIGKTIGKVSKLDFNINNGVRGMFARMAIFINLDKELISQVFINGVVQRIEYEPLPTVCFQCGHYGHIKEICPKREIGLKVIDEETLGDKTNQKHTLRENTGENINIGAYCPWMLVERKIRKSGRAGRKDTGETAIEAEGKSIFQVLENLDGDEFE
ncbi:hypothetical protein PVK06_025058 [Gossypium arboreum]|uniref:CCHC-type domain-containing protein n=1 Tax=Gossypium arboreum TaxID=29729 RepID=A0ABR0PFT3_GOSAR|nr:hypothetical protein PVK06_025058 [Gossypium arboreum]